jgi:hypothetical protein
MDIRTMRDSTPPDRIMTLVVNAPIPGKVLGRMLVKTTNIPLEFCNTLEEALARANMLLKARVFPEICAALLT